LTDVLIKETDFSQK